MDAPKPFKPWEKAPKETPDIREISPDASEFAIGIFEKQPFRGYELTAVLSSDDRRAVFKAHDQTLERPVAVKVMRPWPGREDAVEDFFQLAGSIARLKCPDVARGLNVGRGDGNFFLVYEFLPGESLEAKLARRQTGRLTEKETLKLAAEVAGVLQNLYDKGSPHGNVKPSNIMIADGGVTRLADIGFAWNLAWPTDDEAFQAQPDYLAPERIAGELNVDIRGDLYSLGAVCFRALMGRPVFLGETPAGTLHMHLEEKAPALGTIDPKISAATSQLVRWLLEKDRYARPKTPREFLKKLAAHPLIAQEPETGDGDVPLETERNDMNPTDEHPQEERPTPKQPDETPEYGDELTSRSTSSSVTEIITELASTVQEEPENGDDAAPGPSASGE